MNPLDVILIVLIAVSLAAGLLKGLVSEILGLAGVAGGIVLGLLFGPRMGVYLERWVHHPGAAAALGFACLFVGSLIVASALAALVNRFLDATKMGTGNRLAGGIFGIFRGMLIAVVLVLGLTLFLNAQTPFLRDSRLVPVIGKGGHLLAPLFPEAPRAILERRLDALPTRSEPVLDRENVV